jgi:hypothetical protein
MKGNCVHALQLYNDITSSLVCYAVNEQTPWPKFASVMPRFPSTGTLEENSGKHLSSEKNAHAWRVRE